MAVDLEDFGSAGFSDGYAAAVQDIAVDLDYRVSLAAEIAAKGRAERKRRGGAITDFAGDEAAVARAMSKLGGESMESRDARIARLQEGRETVPVTADDLRALAARRKAEAMRLRQTDATLAEAARGAAFVGITPAEIAEAAGASEATVKAWLREANDA